MENDIIEGEFKCPRCQSVMFEKHPTDTKLIRKSIRFSCKCGHYEDLTISDLLSKGKKIISPY